MHPRVRRPAEPQVNEVLAKRLKLLIEDYPTYGYRRLWALLRFRDGVKVNKKAVYRVQKVKGWLVNQRSTSPRPRVQVHAAWRVRAICDGRSTWHTSMQGRMVARIWWR